LAIFLLLAIVVTAKIIKLVNHLNYIGERAEHIADKAENVADFFSKGTGVASMGNLLSNMVDIVTKKSKKKD
jgi:hypothetical protein